MPRGRRRPAPGGAPRGQLVLSKFFPPRGSLLQTTASSSAPAAALLSSSEKRSEEGCTAASVAAAAEDTDPEPAGKKRRVVKNKEHIVKRSKSLQSVREEKRSTINLLNTGEPKNCTSPRVCSKTLDKLREFSSSLEHLNNVTRSEICHGTQSVDLKKCQHPAVGNMETSDSLHSQYSNKEETCLSISQSSASNMSCENTQNTSDMTLNKRTKSVYTPLELQFLEMKNQYKDVILCVECGYKYRFFGEDAEIAAKELNIYCHQNHNFMTASIPTHRLFVHVRRLVAKGYKVGVVKQMETAALKAVGGNKSSLFTRKLTALYTKSTILGEDVNPLLKFDNPMNAEEMPSDVCDNYLLCISESKVGLTDKNLDSVIGIVAVQPTTGEVIFDSFQDSGARLELESRILRLQPVEVILPTTVSEQTEKLISVMASIRRIYLTDQWLSQQFSKLLDPS